MPICADPSSRASDAASQRLISALLMMPLDYEFLAAGIVFAVRRLFLAVLRLLPFWATRSTTAVIKSSLSVSSANSSWCVVFYQPTIVDLRLILGRVG